MDSREKGGRWLCCAPACRNVLFARMDDWPTPKVCRCVVVVWMCCTSQGDLVCRCLFWNDTHKSDRLQTRPVYYHVKKCVCVCCDTKVTNRRESSRKALLWRFLSQSCGVFHCPRSLSSCYAIHPLHPHRQRGTHWSFPPPPTTDRCYTQTQQNKACPPPPPPLLGNWSRAARGVKFSWLCVPNNARPTEQPAC